MSETTPPTPDRWIGVVLRQPKSDEKKATFTDTLAKTLAGGNVFLGFILTTLAAFQGGLERLLLNRPYGTLLGLGLVGAGIALGFVDAFVKSAPRKKLVVVVALFLFIAGLLVLWHVGTSSLADNERPEITATASIAAEGSKLESHVTAFGLKTNQWVYVSVKGLASEKSEAGVLSTKPERSRSEWQGGPQLHHPGCSKPISTRQDRGSPRGKDRRREERSLL